MADRSKQRAASTNCWACNHPIHAYTRRLTVILEERRVSGAPPRCCRCITLLLPTPLRQRPTTAFPNAASQASSRTAQSVTPKSRLLGKQGLGHLGPDGSHPVQLVITTAFPVEYDCSDLCPLGRGCYRGVLHFFGLRGNGGRRGSRTAGVQRV